MVGFAEGRRARLGDVTITPRSRFSAVYLTAREPDATVASGRHLLVVAMARARNTGMKVVADYLILDRGDAPVVLEPVQADIELTRPGNFTVHVLDHNGRKTGRTLPAEGEFLEVPELDMGRLETTWQEAVFALYLAEEKIEPEVVENMRTWPHSGFSVDQSVFLPAGDRAGIERLVGYMTRCPFSLARLVKVTDTGQVVYKGEKQACRAFPEADGDGLRPGPRRNFQVLDPLDFLAEFTQHIPPKGSHLIRGHRPKVGRGWYSNKARGMRRKAAEAAEQAGATSSSEASEAPAPSRCSQTWAMLIKRVYEIDPLCGPKCQGQMKVVAFLEPPQGAVIEKILRHCGLWHPSTPRAPPPEDGWVYEPDADWNSRPASSDPPGELTYVDIDEFLATF